ncbi:MAG: response regulator [Loktanella sp.]|nr:response regulator [Loktanella sp.]
MDKTDLLFFSRRPTQHQPLLGLTILLVEDSRFASEAIRLMGLRSGARIRRADCLQTARRHLAAYRPTVALVDLGLPDGSGLDLLQLLAEMTPRIPVLIGTSGDTNLQEDVMRTGANGFLAKPITQLATFQTAILRHLPAERQPQGLRLVAQDAVAPDHIALRDDLTHVARLLDQDGTNLPYVTQFLGGIARSANDRDLDLAVRAVAHSCHAETQPRKEIAALSQLVQKRIAAAGFL